MTEVYRTFYEENLAASLEAKQSVPPHCATTTQQQRETAEARAGAQAEAGADDNVDRFQLVFGSIAPECKQHTRICVFLT